MASELRFVKRVQDVNTPDTAPILAIQSSTAPPLPLPLVFNTNSDTSTSSTGPLPTHERLAKPAMNDPSLPFPFRRYGDAPVIQQPIPALTKTTGCIKLQKTRVVKVPDQGLSTIQKIAPARPAPGPPVSIRLNSALLGRKVIYDREDEALALKLQSRGRSVVSMGGLQGKIPPVPPVPEWAKAVAEGNVQRPQKSKAPQIVHNHERIRRGGSYSGQGDRGVVVPKEKPRIGLGGYRALSRGEEDWYLLICQELLEEGVGSPVLRARVGFQSIGEVVERAM